VTVILDEGGEGGDALAARSLEDADSREGGGGMLCPCYGEGLSASSISSAGGKKELPFPKKEELAYHAERIRKKGGRAGGEIPGGAGGDVSFSSRGKKGGTKISPSTLV